MTGHCDIAPDRKTDPGPALIGHGFVCWSARRQHDAIYNLLVLIFERLFKLGEHWQLDHVLKRSFGG